MLKGFLIFSALTLVPAYLYARRWADPDQPSHSETPQVAFLMSSRKPEAISSRLRSPIKEV